MIKKLDKNQSPRIKRGKQAGVIIECDEITVSIFPPPREHGKPHCHVTSKLCRKIKGEKSEVFPEVKVFLDGSEPIIITEGFSMQDLRIIGEVVFDQANNEYLLIIWEKLHGQY